VDETQVDDLVETGDAQPPDFDDLVIEAYRLPDQGVWVFGVTMGGAFISLTSKKLGGVDDDLREAAQPGFKKARADAYAQELRDQRG